MAVVDFSNGRDGRLLWHCHFGCSQDDILQELIALGLYEKEQPHTYRPKIYIDRDDKEKLAYANEDLAARPNVSRARWRINICGQEVTLVH